MPPSRNRINPDSLDEPAEPLPASQDVTDELDPILPLPAGTGRPPIKQGGGALIMASTGLMVVELPYRAFDFLWEYAERRAAEQYPKYVGGPLDNAAQLVLEAVHAFRSSQRGEILPILSEEEAQKIRAKAAKRAAKLKAKAQKQRKTAAVKLRDGAALCPKCKGSASKKKTKNGKKVWKCASCGFKWPRRSPGSAPVEPSKARTAKSEGTTTRKAQTKAQRSKKRPAKRD